MSGNNISLFAGVLSSFLLIALLVTIYYIWKSRSSKDGKNEVKEEKSKFQDDIENNIINLTREIDVIEVFHEDGSEENGSLVCFPLSDPLTSVEMKVIIYDIIYAETI